MQNSLVSRMRGWAKKLPTGLAGAAFWLALWFCVLLVLRLLPGGWGTFFSVTEIFVGIALVAVAVPLALQQVRRRMLWSLRNKLVLTYLLIGLAPVVLVVTLVLISAYIAAGQFAIHLVDSRLQAELSQMNGANAHRANLIAQVLGGQAVRRGDRRTGQRDQPAGCGRNADASGDEGLYQWRADCVGSD